MANKTKNTASSQGLKFSRHFTSNEVSVYEMFDYDYR